MFDVVETILYSEIQPLLNLETCLHKKCRLFSWKKQDFVLWEGLQILWRVKSILYKLSN